MQKRTTFETLSQEYDTKIKNAVHALTMARTNDEVEVANMEIHKVVSKYARTIKQFIQNASLQLISDHAKMQDLLNSMLNSNKFILTYEPMRNTVRWTVQTPYKANYWYISKIGTPVDLENWNEWIRNVLMQ